MAGILIFPSSSKTYEPILILCLLYFSVFLSYASKRFNSFRKNHQVLVTVHTITNLVELAQYYTLPSRYPEASAHLVPFTSLLLCFVQVYTNFALVRKLKRGNPAIVRTTYQGAGLLRLATIIPAYLLESRTLYHDSIVIIHAFVYARLIIYLFTIRQRFPTTEISEIDSFNDEKDKSVIAYLHQVSGAKDKSLITTQQAYTAGIYGSALITVGHQEDELMRKYGVVIFLGLMGLLIRVEQWVGDIVLDYLQSRKMKSFKQRFAWKLYEIGFCRLAVLILVDKAVIYAHNEKALKMQEPSEEMKEAQGTTVS